MNSKNLTNLFIVGAAKSGTTTLFDLLSKSNKIEYLIPFIEADKKKLMNILPSKQFNWLINESP